MSPRDDAADLAALAAVQDLARTRLTPHLSAILRDLPADVDAAVAVVIDGHVVLICTDRLAIAGPVKKWADAVLREADTLKREGRQG